MIRFKNKAFISLPQGLARLYAIKRRTVQTEKWSPKEKHKEKQTVLFNLTGSNALFHIQEKEEKCNVKKKGKTVQEVLREVFPHFKSIKIDQEGERIELDQSNFSHIFHTGNIILCTDGSEYTLQEVKAYSQYSWNDAKKTLSLKEGDIQSWKPIPKKDIKDELLDKLVMRLNEVSEARRIPPSQGNERHRLAFIDEILEFSVRNSNSHEQLDLRVGESLDGTLAWGPLDYAVFSGNGCIVLVVEAKEAIKEKKRQMDKGRAQCYMQMHTAYHKSRISVKEMYGVVTTFSQNIGICYDGRSWKETDEILIPNDFTKEQVKKVTEMILWMIDSK